MLLKTPIVAGTTTEVVLSALPGVFVSVCGNILSTRQCHNEMQEILLDSDVFLCANLLYFCFAYLLYLCCCNNRISPLAIYIKGILSAYGLIRSQAKEWKIDQKSTYGFNGQVTASPKQKHIIGLIFNCTVRLGPKKSLSYQCTFAGQTPELDYTWWIWPTHVLSKMTIFQSWLPLIWPSPLPWSGSPPVLLRHWE